MSSLITKKKLYLIDKGSCVSSWKNSRCSNKILKGMAVEEFEKLETNEENEYILTEDLETSSGLQCFERGISSRENFGYFNFPQRCSRG